MIKNKKILVFVGIITVIGLAFFTYQIYFFMPEFENKTLVKGLQLSLPIDSNFVEVSKNTFHDDKTNLDIKVLKSENDVINANVSNPKETINSGSNSIKVFENYTVVTDKKNEIGIKISNITDGNRNIAMKIAESVVLSSSLKSKKIGEEKATEIFKSYETYLSESLPGDISYTFTGITLTKFNGKNVYNATFTFKVSAYGYSVNDNDEYIYIDAYNGKILDGTDHGEFFNRNTLPKIMN